MPNEHAGDTTGRDKDYTIVVNSREHTVEDKRVTYEQLVALAGVPTTDGGVVTITYSRGEHKKPQGSLTPGETVNVKDGMIFDVTSTVQS